MGNIMTNEDMNKALLVYPDTQVCIFGETLKTWLFYIIICGGEAKITHKRPYENAYKAMSGHQLLAYTDTQVVNAICGEWKVDETTQNRVRFYRIDYAISGTKVIEELVVDMNWYQD